MALKVGSADVTDVKLGATQVAKVMLGAEQVWPTESALLTFTVAAVDALPLTPGFACRTSAPSRNGHVRLAHTDLDGHDTMTTLSGVAVDHAELPTQVDGVKAVLKLRADVTDEGDYVQLLVDFRGANHDLETAMSSPGGTMTIYAP